MCRHFIDKRGLLGDAVSVFSMRNEWRFDAVAQKNRGSLDRKYTDRMIACGCGLGARQCFPEAHAGRCLPAPLFYRAPCIKGNDDTKQYKVLKTSQYTVPEICTLYLSYISAFVRCHWTEAVALPHRIPATPKLQRDLHVIMKVLYHVNTPRSTIPNFSS